MKTNENLKKIINTYSLICDCKDVVLYRDINDHFKNECEIEKEYRKKVNSIFFIKRFTLKKMKKINQLIQ